LIQGIWVTKVSFFTSRLDSEIRVNEGHVTCYTWRQLTYEHDILNAFAAILIEINQQLKTKFFWGLPQNYFSRALLWIGSERPNVDQIRAWCMEGKPGSKVPFPGLGKKITTSRRTLIASMQVY
jgi:hypothetical protein